jgi:hypothetical protein
VTQTSSHSSWKTSLTRVIANLVGALGGAALRVVIGHLLWAMAIGVMFTGLVCYILKADDAMRPAFAAVVIVIFNADTAKRSSSLDRVVGFFLTNYPMHSTFCTRTIKKARPPGVNFLRHENTAGKRMGFNHRRIERIRCGGGNCLRRTVRKTSTWRAPR